MFIGPIVAEELKRIIRESEITKYEVACARAKSTAADISLDREDDVTWPKKNIVGRQELEVRIDKEHISFEVSFACAINSGIAHFYG